MANIRPAAWRTHLIPEDSMTTALAGASVSTGTGFATSKGERLSDMNIEAIFGKTIMIRLTEDQDAFVSTLRYGPLIRRSKSWPVTPAEETVRGSRLYDPSSSEEYYEE